MKIIEVESNLFKQIVGNSTILFNSVGFAEMNRHKVQKTHYLIFKEKRMRFGLLLGVLGTHVSSPYSAPYGGIFPIDARDSALFLQEAIEALLGWLKQRGYSEVTFGLPPAWISEDFYHLLENSLFLKGFQVRYMDINHRFELPDNFDVFYPKILRKNARKHLRNALGNNLEWEKLGPGDASRAYDVIRVNRSAKRRPLRMTFDELIATSEIIPTDFFVVSQKGIDVAAAIVYHIDKDIIYVTYWGHDTLFSHLRPMNFLAFKLFQYYASLRKKVVDLGISSEYGVPNYGLCSFKESLGCRIGLKYTFFREIF